MPSPSPSPGSGGTTALRVLATALVALLVVAGCSGGDSGVPGDEGLVRLVVVGDSLTSGEGELHGQEEPGDRSWVPAAIGLPLSLGDGWAERGATTSDMRSGVRPMDGDVAVLMAGTNDLADGVPWAASRDNLLAVTRVIGVSPIVLAAVPPYEPDPAGAVALNEQLRLLALEQGWVFTDPWDGLGSQGEWAEGHSDDGIHPDQETADEVGRRLRIAVLDVAGG